MTDVELLPLPERHDNFQSFADWKTILTDYARANVLHHTAAQAAEIERLQSAYEAMTRQAQHHMEKQDEAEVMLAKAVKAGEVMARRLDACEARAERLAEALRDLLDETTDRIDCSRSSAGTIVDVVERARELLRDQEEGE